MTSVRSRVLAVLAVMSLFFTGLTGVANAAVPGVPSITGLVPSDKAMTITWGAVANIPTDYIIEYSPDAFSSVTYTFPDAVSTATTVQVTGLTNGNTYWFRIKAKNGDGTSAASTALAAVPTATHTPNDLALFDACPGNIIPSAGFTDTTSPDVACVKYYGITLGTTATTFSPLDSVTRWQMALFLTRMVTAATATLPSGVSQGFTDISGKSGEIKTAINQLKQLGITVGKTATTYDPDGYVTREEMALFLERLLKKVPVGPGGNEEFITGSSGSKEIKSLDTDHNFTDLGTVSIMGMQAAIKNLWNLGVTEVATATVYEPSTNISRLNMAQMMANALDHTNARVAGINIQSSNYTGAASGATISVTHRTPDLKVVSGTSIDTFRYLYNTTSGWSRFSSNGACAQTTHTTVSITKCYIDLSERKTDVKGNLATFIEAISAGQIYDYYAWTAATGVSYDHDIHGSAVSSITIRG